MRKILCFILVMLIAVSFAIPTLANDTIKVRLDGELIKFDVQPQIINDRTMVPLRAIFEALDATVEWDGATQTVTSTKDNTTIILTINHSLMYVNGKGVVLDSPACLVGGRTLVPVRAISEAFNLNVEWDGNNKTVFIEATNNYVIATDKGFRPFEFQDADGNIVGIDMDILAAIAEDQGFTYDLQYIGWDAAIAACQAGQADGMIAGASITEARQENGWIFSECYYDATQGMAVAKDSNIAGFADVIGKKVAVKNGTMSKQYAESIKDLYGFEVIDFDLSFDMYQAVILGQVDACLDDTPILKYNIKIGELEMKFVEGTENDPAQYGFAIFDTSKQELVDKFNAGLKNIKENGRYDEIIAKYLG